MTNSNVLLSCKKMPPIRQAYHVRGCVNRIKGNWAYDDGQSGNQAYDRAYIGNWAYDDGRRGNQAYDGNNAEENEIVIKSL